METDKVRQALDAFKEVLIRKEAFIKQATNDGLEEPSCGYAKFDETVTDYNYELAELGEGLADAVAEALGKEE